MIERRVEGKIKLYSRKILIQEEAKDLLPNYLRFLEGVVDSEDLPLNVSRETIQSNQVLQRIRRTLTTRMIREITDLETKEPETFATFWEQFGVFIKEGVATDFESRTDLLKLLRFYTTKSEGKLTSLADYKQRMLSDQQDIYYVLAGNREAAERSPHLDPLRARDIEVLLLSDIMDSFMLTSLRDYEGSNLRNIDDANLELPGEEAATESSISDEAFEALRSRFTAILGDRVTDVQASKVLRDSPSRLVSTQDAAMREMSRIQHLLGQESQLEPRALELNRGHPLIASLAERVTRNADDPLVLATAEQLYDNALLLEGLLTNPAAMVPRIESLLTAAVQNASETD